MASKTINIILGSDGHEQNSGDSSSLLPPPPFFYLLLLFSVLPWGW
jgi:hypothetical protein